MSAPGDKPRASAWSPLRIGAFRALWLAALASNVGNGMHEVGAAWLMTSLTPSPLMVALIGTAMSLPLFLLGLPAGAIGDVVDRRKFLILSLVWKTLAAAGLGVAALFGFTTPWVLLTFTLALGIGVAMYTPVWQAITPELVPREELPSAIALNGIAINVARAIGPAAGGFLLAALNPGFVFLLNAASYVAVAVVVYRWPRPVVDHPLPAERVLAAMRSGVRYVRYTPEFRAVCVRAGLFILFGSAVWALLPIIGRQELGFGALGYGLLVGALGVGAVTTATILPWLRSKLSTDTLLNLATAAFAVTALALAFIRAPPLVFLAMFLGGVGWISIMSSLNTAAQQTSAMWVRARTLAVYAIVFQGGTALGSAVWGIVASRFGVGTALSAAAVGMLVTLALVLRYRLSGRDEPDLTPSVHWPQPLLVTEARPTDGPALVSVEYHIAPESADAFLATVHDLARVRRRDGAFEWGVYRDTEEPTRFVEEFLVESWAEHLRQHERFTTTDRELEERVRASHVGDVPVRVSHHIYARRPSNKSIPNQ